ncbi:MAG: DUF4315 family protein [Ruminococcus sp.]|nr:DUF4315 family protein [Ruminococcus sp.]
MNPKYIKVCSDIEKTEAKITELQDRLSSLQEKKTELENLEIINAVRESIMDRNQIFEFLDSIRNGKLPQQDFSQDTMKSEVYENE